jgi:hypothetical protein
LWEAHPEGGRWCHSPYLPAAGQQLQPVTTGVENMLYTLALVLIIAWLLGFISSYTIGGFIHILLVIAIILILVRIIQGQKL